LFEKGGIDLDVASCAAANTRVKAKRYFTKQDNALKRSWKAANVFGNFPGGIGDDHESVQGQFVDKAISEYRSGNFKNGLFLCKLAFNTKWGQKIVQHPFGVIKKNQKFFVPNSSGIAASKRFSPHSYIIFYLGKEEKNFVKQFGSLCLISGISMWTFKNKQV
jgi:hypothetical protein